MDSVIAVRQHHLLDVGKQSKTVAGSALPKEVASGPADLAGGGRGSPAGRVAGVADHGLCEVQAGPLQAGDIPLEQYPKAKNSIINFALKGGVRYIGEDIGVGENLAAESYSIWGTYPVGKGEEIW